MIEKEFEQLKLSLWRNFPALSAWGKTLDMEQRDRLKARWWADLKDIPYQNALAAVSEIASSKADPWPYPGDKERAGAIVAIQAGKSMAAPESKADAYDEWRERRKSPAVGLTQGIFASVVKAIADSPDHDAACQEHREKTGRCRLGCPVPRQAAAKVLAAEQSGLESDQSRYSCRFCQDRGTVPILRPDEVGRIAATKQVGFSPRYWLAACSCSAGTAHSSWGGIMVFDPQRHAAWSGDEKAVVTSCIAIVEDCGGRRVAAFDAFNAAGEMQYSA